MTMRLMMIELQLYLWTIGLYGVVDVDEDKEDGDEQGHSAGNDLGVHQKAEIVNIQGLPWTGLHSGISGLWSEDCGDWRDKTLVNQTLSRRQQQTSQMGGNKSQHRRTFFLSEQAGIRLHCSSFLQILESSVNS